MSRKEEILGERSQRSANARTGVTNDTAFGRPGASTEDDDREDAFRIGGRAFWLAQLAFWGGFGAVTYLTFLGQLEPGQRLPVALLKLVIRPVLGLAASTLLMFGYRRWLDRRGADPTWFAGAAVVAACTGMAVLWYLASSSLFRPFSPFPGPVDWAQVPRSLLEYVFVLLAWSTGYFWLRSRRDARRRERQALRAEAAARTAQLELLAQQLNPHFLFNALTSLRGLIHDDPDRAEAVLGRLAAFLRRTLARPATRVGPLADELDHVAAYLEVERSRYGPGLEVEFDIRPPAERAAIPAFLLHPLIENAVKHGRARDGEPRRVEIRAELDGERLRVVVSNPGALRREARRRGADPIADPTTASDGAGRPLSNRTADSGVGAVSSPASSMPPMHSGLASSSNHRAGPDPGPAEGTGVGLRNVRRRLSQYSPGRHRVRLLEEDGWVHAVIEIDPRALPLPDPAGDAAGDADGRTGREATPTSGRQTPTAAATVKPEEPGGEASRA